MEAKDLMIGDWVQVPCLIDNVENYIAYCKVKQLRDCDLDVVGFKELKYNEIIPISLTPEILEKNGFVKVENTQTSTIMYSFRDTLNRIGVFDFNHVTIDSYYTDSSCDVFISSVHELQHALRLCGIKKEIKL